MIISLYYDDSCVCVCVCVSGGGGGGNHEYIRDVQYIGGISWVVYLGNIMIYVMWVLFLKRYGEINIHLRGQVISA